MDGCDESKWEVDELLLRGPLEALVREVCEMFPKLPTTQRMRIVSMQASATFSAHVPVPDWLRVAGHLHQSPAFRRLTSVLDAGYALGGDSTWNLYLGRATSGGQARRVFTDFLRPYIEQIAEARGQLEWDQGAFDASMRILLREGSRPMHVSLRALSPLAGIDQLPDESIEVEDGLVLRRLTLSELDNVVTGHSAPWVPALARTAIEICGGFTMRTDKDPALRELGVLQELEQKAMDLLAVLRLVLDAPVDRIVTATETRTLTSLESQRSVPLTRANMVAPGGALTAEDIQTVKSVWNASRQHGLLALPLSRVSIAWMRSSHEDRLIDYWVGLESLFLQGMNDELKFRAAIRIAEFLGATGDERVRYFEQIKKSYDLRSKVVHGSRFRAADLAEAESATRAALRLALLKIARSDKPFRPEELDSRLLRREEGTRK